ncbi:ATP-binding protein [Arachnia propionica]|uniref:ATP-binding protein n=1 Tax=Arachnia propionica TaxID=1750 RepID=A0A3P1WU00_9ACTN|nr:DUF4143 domain-containing protein [Arachnia propionica]RRD48840.1 ATP-binding protein [Arachnia propionica]
MGYRRRVLDDLLDELFPHLPAIAIEGAKGVGKTATARQHSRSEVQLDDPVRRQALSDHPDSIQDEPSPLLIDEWQLVPQIWDHVRRAVDVDPSGGRFLLTGSATPAPEARMHSGAGRIASFLLRPMSLAERGVSEPTVSMAALLEGGGAKISGHCSLTLPDYVEEILRSGFPGIRDLPEPARSMQLDSYLARMVDRDLPEAGVRVRRRHTLLAWLRAHAAATATDASHTAILNAATPGESDKPARQTVKIYREHLENIFVLDPLPAWIPSFSPLKRLTLASKHHLVDPALAARLVGVGAGGLLRGEGPRIQPDTGTWVGALFESLVTQSVRVHAQPIRATVSHARTKNTDHEIDLIVESDDLRVLAIEVKLAGAVADADVRHLNWLKGQLGDRVVDRVVINTGPYAYRRQDGVAVVPLGLLGP